MDSWILSYIKDHGPLSVADYMDLCLYNPLHGYYMTKNPLGNNSDFLTAPETSQIFGEIIGIAFLELWHRMSCPPIHMIEMGPGQGTLMQDLWRIMPPDFKNQAQIHLVEVSPFLKDVQQSRLKGANILWHKTIDSALAASQGCTFFIANELFDALPIQQQVLVGETWVDRQVIYNAAKNKLQFIPEIESPQIREHCPMAKPILMSLDKHIGLFGGMGLVFDYGYVGDVEGDTLQAMRAHKYVDVLEMPGDCDITTHVNFKALSGHIHTCKIHGPTTQGSYLQELGIHIRAERLRKQATPAEISQIDKALHRLLDEDQMGTLFKVIAFTGPGTPTPIGFSRCIQVSS